jgi:vancomycin aglycone glucosyltransferase
LTRGRLPPARIAPVEKLLTSAPAGGASQRSISGAGELVAAQFDTVAAAAEGCDALVAIGVMPAGVRL